MRIFKDNGKIRFQLMDMESGIMLFDFSIEENLYEELKEHMIIKLMKFKP